MTDTDTDTDRPRFDPSSLPVLTHTGVLECLDIAVRRYGDDYCDPNASEGDGCRNVYRDEHGETKARCIAAEVLFQWGVPDEELRRCNDDPISSTIAQLGLTERMGPGAQVMLGVAQSAQDNGDSWRKAKRMASRARDEMQQTGLLDRE